MKLRAVHKLSVLGMVTALSACNTTAPSPERAWRIEPVLKVAHSSATAHAYYGLGRYYDGMQAWQRSVEAYRKSLSLDPANVETRNALAVAMGDWAGSRKLKRSSVRRCPPYLSAPTCSATSATCCFWLVGARRRCWLCTPRCG